MCPVCETTVVTEPEVEKEKEIVPTMNDRERWDAILQDAVAVMTMTEKYPCGYGITETGELYTIGYTGKRTVQKISAVLDHLISGGSAVKQQIISRLYETFPLHIDIVSGDDIHQAFADHIRHTSCMRCSKVPDEMRQVYSENPDDVCAVIWRKADNLWIPANGSALVWKGKRRCYLERCYSAEYLNLGIHVDGLCKALSEFFGKPTVPIYCRGEVNRLWDKTVNFRLRIPSDGVLPYMDSWCFTDVDRRAGTFLLTTGEGIDSDDVGGTPLYSGARISVQRCCACNCRIDDDDSLTTDDGDIYCESCYHERYSHCEWREQDYPVSEISKVEVWSYGSVWEHRRGRSSNTNLPTPHWRSIRISSDALCAHFTKLSDNSGRYVHDSLVVRDAHGNCVDPDPDCGEWAVTEDGEVYPNDEVCHLENGECHPIEDCVEIDGVWYHQDNLPEGYEIEEQSPPVVSEETPIEYRILYEGETIQEGDEYQSMYNKGWHKTAVPGAFVRFDQSYRRPIRSNADRIPFFSGMEREQWRDVRPGEIIPECALVGPYFQDEKWLSYSNWTSEAGKVQPPEPGTMTRARASFVPRLVPVNYPVTMVTPKEVSQ